MSDDRREDHKEQARLLELAKQFRFKKYLRKEVNERFKRSAEGSRFQRSQILSGVLSDLILTNRRVTKGGIK